MKRTFLAVLAAGVIALGTGVPAWAHHSFAAAYDTSQRDHGSRRDQSGAAAKPAFVVRH